MSTLKIALGGLSADAYRLNIAAVIGDTLHWFRIGGRDRYVIELPDGVRGTDVIAVEAAVPSIMCSDGSVFSWLAETWRPVASVAGQEAFEKLAAANSVTRHRDLA